MKSHSGSAAPTPDYTTPPPSESTDSRLAFWPTSLAPYALARDGADVGDHRRFRIFADVIAERFPNFRERAVVDVAGGKGMLRAELTRRGFGRVETVDKRQRLAKGRPGQRYALFDWQRSPDYALVAAMHPDEATDHAILYAAARRVPFIVCPCCIKPSAAPYDNGDGRGNKRRWLHHLSMLAVAGRMRIERFDLGMDGDKHVIVGEPIERRCRG